MKKCAHILGQSYMNLVISQNLSEFNMIGLKMTYLDSRPIDKMQLHIINFIVCEVVGITFARYREKDIRKEVSRLLSSRLFRPSKNEGENGVCAASAHRVISPMLENIFPTSQSLLFQLSEKYIGRERKKESKLTSLDEHIDLIDFEAIGIIGQPKHLYTEGLYRIVAEEV
ncbi:hypothetical protein Ciccas_000394 [Cichlidogyrus casuarinus]|uniref:Uncharacterized protein n=1 Tax=Cichlidogyrus casuarinus TaxID=1844966 RepID=A0ABD2QMZ5_9PLAT